jgi:DNA-binding NtrC family response regulator
MKTSFVADGDRDFLSLAERQLTLLGYQVAGFKTSTELVKSLNQKPSLIILSELRDGSNPVETIRALRKELPGVIIIHVARTNSFTDAVTSVRAGATEFIEKNSASFVRLRTSLELISQQKRKKTPASILNDIKKVFIG